GKAGGKRSRHVEGKVRGHDVDHVRREDTRCDRRVPPGSSERQRSSAHAPLRRRGKRGHDDHGTDERDAMNLTHGSLKMVSDGKRVAKCHAY
ncbi:MAG: hypothetical protein ACK56F_05380, partial [bacterium]